MTLDLGLSDGYAIAQSDIRRGATGSPVAITGLGAVSALGQDLSQFWHALKNGLGGIGLQTRFSPDRFRCKLAGQCDEAAVKLSPGPFSFEIARSSLFVRLALYAAQQAFVDGNCGVDDRQLVPQLSGRGQIHLGVAMGGLPNIEAGVLRQEDKGVRKTLPFLIPSLIPNMAASMIALRHEIHGPQYTIAGACAAGAQALGLAMHAISRGECDWALAGGAEAVTTPIAYSGFEAMSATTTEIDSDKTPRPFDVQRDGLVPGEGAAIVLLESLDQARARGKKIHGLLRGYANNSGAESLTAISVEPTVKCMQAALDDAGILAEDVDMVFAQASGTWNGDLSEALALREVFGQCEEKFGFIQYTSSNDD